MTFLIIVHVIICSFLVFVILLQPGKGDAGIGFGSSSQSIFGSKGAGNFLTKTTSVCAILFLFTSFLLTRSRIKEFSGIDIKEGPAKAAPPSGTPSGAAPVNGDPAKGVPAASAPPAAASPAPAAPTKK